jgi:diaminopimelate decarboxylase
MAQMSRTTATATGGPVAGSPVYPLGSAVSDEGHLIVGGCDVADVAREFGTPAYIYASDDIRARARTYTGALRGRGVDAEVLYASKAAPITAVYRICREEGLSVDIASGGELHMALAAGFDPARIYMHGNNKSAAELRMAFAAGIGCIVVDSLDEIARADWLADRDQDVLIRLTPGITASTHSYVQTGQIDSKFGFAIEGGQAEAAVAAVNSSRHLRLAGFHAHIGSQIYELDPYVHAIELMA